MAWTSGWVLVLGFCSSLPCAGQQLPPDTFVDEGACPFECCTYGPWRVDESTQLLAEPRSDAGVVGTVGKGSGVEGVTGRVVTTRPGQLEVLKRYQSGDSGQMYLPGERVNVYTYLGEGYFRVWHDGAMRDEDAGFLLHDVAGWIGCVDEGTCWGKRESLPESTWWVKIRAPHGLSGWTDQLDHFAGMDACG